LDVPVFFVGADAKRKAKLRLHALLESGLWAFAISKPANSSTGKMPAASLEVINYSIDNSKGPLMMFYQRTNSTLILGL
jgi:hypothetical protein